MSAAAVPVEFFLSMSGLLHMYNPLLLLSEDDVVPVPLCSGASFPIACTRGSSGGGGDGADLSQHLKESQSGPVFVTGGGHLDLIRQAQ